MSENNIFPNFFAFSIAESPKVRHISWILNIFVSHFVSQTENHALFLFRGELNTFNLIHMMKTFGLDCVVLFCVIFYICYVCLYKFIWEFKKCIVFKKVFILYLGLIHLSALRYLFSHLTFRYFVYQCLIVYFYYYIFFYAIICSIIF